MYNERKDSFSIKDLVVQILFIVLFVFILIWLFPTKSHVDKNSGNANQEFDVLTNRIFNENLQIMKEAAISYYTTSRLPKNVNDVEKMTLRKMLEEKLLIEFKDANNKSCDLDESYVEITRLEDEYILKINLSCTDNDAYILVHLGCYDYCLTDVCENKDVPPSKPIVNKPTPQPEDPKPEEPKPEDPKPEEPKPDTPVVTCRYKYEKVEPNQKWSAWSNWSTKVETATSTKQVDTKDETTTEEIEVPVEKVETFIDKSKPILKMVYFQNTTASVSYCASYKEQYTSTGEKKYEWIDLGTSYYNEHPKDGVVNGVTYKYEYEGSTTIDCADCYNGVLHIYRKYKLKIYDVVTKGEDVCSSWNELSVPIFATNPIPKIIGYETYTKTTQVYEKQTITKVTKYYRSRTLSTTYTTLTEWSSVENDQNLLGQGYNYVTSECK